MVNTVIITTNLPYLRQLGSMYLLESVAINPQAQSFVTVLAYNGTKACQGRQIRTVPTNVGNYISRISTHCSTLGLLGETKKTNLEPSKVIR